MRQKYKLCYEMHINTWEEDLNCTHQVDNPKVVKDGKLKPIVIKFVHYAVCDILYQNKKLQGTRFLITESLTVTHVGLLKEAQRKYGVKKHLDY